MKAGKILIWFSLITTLVLFFMAKITEEVPWMLSWTAASQLVSLLGLTLLGISFLLSSRFFFIEYIFGGLDKVYKYHHISGGIAFVLLLNHPIFLLVNALPNSTLAWKYVAFSNILPYNYGVIGLYSMGLMLVLTLLINLPYSIWKKTHDLMGVALLFSALHVLTISSDVSRYQPLRLWVIIILITSFWAVVYKKFLYSRIGPKFDYKVDTVDRVGEIVDIWLTPISVEMKYEAGQFVFAEFTMLGNEAHPFSIACSQTDGRIRLAIKVLGDYTLQVRNITKGDIVKIWGPYGSFNQGTFTDKDLVWIAGGIGVTPFLGLLDKEINLNKNRKVDLFYCFATEEDKVFAEEIIKKIGSSSSVKYWEYCSANNGRITANSIADNLGSLSNKKIMLCGPVPMMESLADQLKDMGVKNIDIIFEDFNFK